MLNNQKAIMLMAVFVILSPILTQTVYAANTVVATITVGSGPWGVAYDSAKHEIFVPNNGPGTLSVIDDTTNTISTTITIGVEPNNAVYDSGKHEVFVANSASNTVSVIDDSTNTVVATITGLHAPTALAYDSAKGEIFVANFNGSVSVIDDNTNSIIATITAGTNPAGIAYDSAKGEIFVANLSSNSVSVISDSTNTVVATITVGADPRDVAYDSGKGEIFVSNQLGNSLSVISDSTNTVVATITVGSNPWGVAYDSAKGEIFVSNNSDNTVSVIDDSTNTVVATITVGSGPRGVAYDSGKGEIFVSNYSGGTVSVIDAGDPPPSSTKSKNGGHVYNPPSIGNDYHNQYGSGISINGKPFDVKNYHSIIPQQVLTIGNPSTFDFKIFDERGGNTVSHVGMYLHFKGDVMVPKADTWIVWDKKDGIQVNDPGKLFSSVTVSTNVNGSYRDMTFTITPQKTMPDSALVMRMWDDKLASGDVPIWGAIIIVDPNAPVPVQKIPDNQYGDYATLQNMLDKDGYDIPSLLHHQRDMQQDYSSIDINWIYDKSNDKLTMIESDKSGNVLGDIVYNLYKKSQSPTATDHDYVYIPTQLNRQDTSAEQVAMQNEAQKAEMYITNVSYVSSTAPSFMPTSDSISILDDYQNTKLSQIYYNDHHAEELAMKSEAQNAEQLAQSLGLVRLNNFVPN
jgi:YVTN family beta-propeller protein